MAQKQLLYRYVLMSFLKVTRSLILQMFGGRLFHNLRAAVENDRSLNVVFAWLFLSRRADVLIKIKSDIIIGCR